MGENFNRKTMNQEQEEIIIRLVRDYLDQYEQTRGVYVSGESKVHVINIGANILAQKWDIASYSPGSFVKAFLNNDLEQTFSRADQVNKRYIEFYLMLCANVGMPEELQNID